MTYSATVTITLRKSILDPQGKATLHALHNLGLAAVESVRIGKHVVLQIDAADEQEAERIASEAAGKLLANGVMEDFTVSIAPALQSA